MDDDNPVIYVVDDDIGVRQALDSLLRSAGLEVKCFGDAASFLEHPRAARTACLVLDVRLPGLSGMELLQASSRTSHDSLPPVVMITGHGNIPMSVRAMKAGAVEFLSKPFKPADLLTAIREALARDRQHRQRRAELAALRRRYETLTRREHEILNLVVEGQLNKQIAARLSISEVTVKLHRGHVMQKMGMTRLADLVRAVERLTSPSFGTELVRS